MDNKISFGLLIGFCLLWTPATQSQAPAARDAAEAVDVAALQAEVERLRSIMPGQWFAMTQVAYNFNNLWFAAQGENWDMAQFFFNETGYRLRWALRITSTRKISSGELALTPILEALEANEFAALRQAVAARDGQRFESAYRAMLDGCNGCHAASERPFLRLQIPVAPAEPMLDFDTD
jgi:hypothetical protein